MVLFVLSGDPMPTFDRHRIYTRGARNRLYWVINDCIPSVLTVVVVVVVESIDGAVLWNHTCIPKKGHSPMP